MTTHTRIRLIRMIGHLKGTRYLWEADKEVAVDGGGYLVYGTVQADHQGEAIAEETWEDEE